MTTERLEFINVATYFLKRLAQVVAVNKKNYAEATLCEQGISGVLRENIRMGSNKTWHGHPDGWSDWAPLSAVISEDPSGEVSDGGKTVLEAKEFLRLIT